MEESFKTCIFTQGFDRLLEYKTSSQQSCLTVVVKPGDLNISTIGKIEINWLHSFHSFYEF